MATFACRVQFLDDTDPFNSTNFPEPTRPPHFTFREDIPLINQIAGVHRLLKAPHKRNAQQLRAILGWTECLIMPCPYTLESSAVIGTVSDDRSDKKGHPRGRTFLFGVACSIVVCIGTLLYSEDIPRSVLACQCCILWLEEEGQARLSVLMTTGSQGQWLGGEPSVKLLLIQELCAQISSSPRTAAFAPALILCTTV
ncbi:unnamed protein product [Leuciscus chuanchicus]